MWLAKESRESVRILNGRSYRNVITLITERNRESVDQCGRGATISYSGTLLQNKSALLFRSRHRERLIRIRTIIPDVFPLKVKLRDNNFFEFCDAPDTTIAGEVRIYTFYLKLLYFNIIY